MSPRVQAQTIQKRFRTPRIPFLLSRFDFAFKALTKRIFLFDQSFFITHSNRLRRFNRIAVFKIASLEELFFQKELFSQYDICFPTSV